MSFIEHIAFDVKRVDIVKLLKEETIPLVIWGAGNVTELALGILKRDEVNVDAVFEWPKLSKELFHGKKVYSLEEIEKRYPKYNVMVGHSHYTKAKELLKYASNIKNIYYMFSYDYSACNSSYFSSDIIKENIKEYEEVYEALGDELSKKNLIAFINTKMTGDVQYVFDVFEKEMSIFANDIYRLQSSECYWNIGCGKGETICEFLEAVNNKFTQVVGLEPDPVSYSQLNEFIDSTDGNILGYRKAAWDKHDKVSFSQNRNEDSQLGGIQVENDDNSLEVEGLPLDELFFENDCVLPPTLITANYFFGMNEMLLGAKNVLKNIQPKMAIIVGHNDEYGIPRVMKTIYNANSNYKFYLRFNQALATTLVMYAVCE